MAILFNISNHPFALWSEKQQDAARQYGHVIDIPFPSVAANYTEEDITALAESLTHDILQYSAKDIVTAHVMGEMNLTYAIVMRLRAAGIACIASTTERMVSELGDGRSEKVFEFVKFRKYE